MILGTGALTVYHGSYTVVEKVDLHRCRKRNDFGQGFYVTTDRAQAERFVKTAVRKSGKTVNAGVVNTYVLRDTAGLRVHEFSGTDAEWLHCVCAHRRGGTAGIAPWQPYDVLAGKIANDDTMTVLTIYLAGGYGDYGSADAIATAIRLLKPERLRDQLCIKTAAAVQRLEFTGYTEVPFND
jgi:hypothetical protein